MRSLVFSLSIALGCAATGRSADAWHLTTPRRPPAATCVGCSFPPPLRMPAPPREPPRATVDSNDPRGALDAAIASASPGGRRVLSSAREMIDSGAVVRGSCYRWVQAVYRRAGGRSHAVFQGDRRQEFRDQGRLQPGDWIFFVNHSYGDVTHSAIFVGWRDEAAREALTLSYPGEHRAEPGRFNTYELSNVYRVVRMRDVVDEDRAPSRRSRARASRGR